MNIIFSDFRCWGVNDVHFEVAIRTQFPLVMCRDDSDVPVFTDTAT